MVAILSSLVAKEFEEKTNIRAISLPPYEKLDTPVSTHADMLLSVIDKNIFVYNEYFELNKELFLDITKEYRIIKIKKECQSKYPNDIALNVLVIGKKIFCNVKNTAEEILSYANENKYKVVNLSQGYSACSTLVIGENSAITADKGVYNTLLSEGVDALLISNEGIHLSGYNCGFIGGAGAFCNGKIFFFGDIEKHIDFDKISEFIRTHNCTYFSVLSGEVSDFGGVKFL